MAVTSETISGVSETYVSFLASRPTMRDQKWPIWKEEWFRNKEIHFYLSFLAGGTQFKDSSWEDPSYPQCTFHTCVPKLQVTSAALPAGKDANQILIWTVEFADGWLFVMIYVQDGRARGAENNFLLWLQIESRAWILCGFSLFNNIQRKEKTCK